jgi:hypothetical protein
MLLFALCLWNCRTTKTATKETVHIATEQHDNVTATGESHTVTNVATNLSDQSTENDSTVTTVVNELLSAPDAVGNQYPTQRTTTTQKNYRNKKNDVKLGSKANVDKANKSNLNKKSDSKSDATTKVKTNEEIKTAMPVWIQKLIGILVAILIIGVCIVLSDFGVFPWVRGAIGRIFGKK